MPRRVSRGLFGALLTLAVLAVPGSIRIIEAQQGSSVRVLQYRADTPIVDRLRPDDSVVALVDDANRTTLPGNVAYGEVLEDAVARSSLVVVAEVQQSSAELNERRTMISTHVTLAAREVLWPESSPVAPGQVVEMWTTGGEMMIRNVLVRASPVPRFQAGRRYLMFLTKHPESQMLVPVHLPLLIERGRTVSILKPEDRRVADRMLNGRSIAEVSKRIRRTPR